MRGALALARAIDALNGALGKASAWFIFAAILISATNAVVRKLFDTSSNAWLELQWYLFGAVFLIGASWTLIEGQHIRIDIVSNLFPRRVRSWIDLLGHIFFLLPMTAVLVYTSYPFVLRSYFENEQSMNAGGLPVYPAKLLILIGFSLLLLQAVSEIIKRIAIMTGAVEERQADREVDGAEAEAARLKALLEEEARAKGLSPQDATQA